MSQDDGKRTTTGYVGWAMHGLYVVGTVSFLAGVYNFVLPFVMAEPEWTVATVATVATGATGAGVCWIATALSFGLLFNGLTRR